MKYNNLIIHFDTTTEKEQKLSHRIHKFLRNAPQIFSVFLWLFYENPYFENETLSITLESEEETPKSSKGTKIVWKNNPTIKTVQKK